MIAWNNVWLLVEIKPAKKNWGPKFGPYGPKWVIKVGFLSFFQIWLIGFPGNCIGWKLGTLSKTHGKNFSSPKLDPTLGFLPFSQDCIIIFSWYSTRLQLGTMSSRAETWKRDFVPQIRAEIIFSILVSSSVHSNLLV